MLTIRSTGSSNSSHPRSRTRRVRGAVDLIENLLAQGVLVLAQGQPDDVHVVLLDSALHHGGPAAADVEQCHSGLEVQLAQREVDLGDLRLFERHVIALVVRAAVGTRRVLEQTEEFVGGVVMRLDVLVGRPQIRRPLRPAVRHLRWAFRRNLVQVVRFCCCERTFITHFSRFGYAGDFSQVYWQTSVYPSRNKSAQPSRYFRKRS